MTRTSQIWRGLALVPILAIHPGGWATITVEDLPEYFVAGQKRDLRFTIRQHGRTPLNDLTPRVRATLGGRQATAVATRGRAAGQYVAALTLPEPGEWTVNIHSGFGKSEITLLPILAVAPGARPEAVTSDAERGRRLFVAKGCVGCHVNAAVQAGPESPVGPELTARHYPVEYLERLLADPQATLGSRGRPVEMPNLDLDHGEITALVAFLNAGARVSSR
jgi:hypothetical protein